MKGWVHLCMKHTCASLLPFARSLESKCIPLPFLGATILALSRFIRESWGRSYCSSFSEAYGGHTEVYLEKYRYSVSNIFKLPQFHMGADPIIMSAKCGKEATIQSWRNNKMPIVVNTNSAATSASFNLSKANDALRRSLSRLSSGNRITNPAEDAGGLAVAYKLDSQSKRTEAVPIIIKMPFLFCSAGWALQTVGNIVSRMSELRTMAADITKNNSDVENYSKEFRELQLQLNQIQREKFNGISLFTVDNVGLKTASLESAVSTRYDYTNSLGNAANLNYNSYARELKTHPSGVSDDGHIKLNVVNLQHVLTVISLGASNAGNDVNLGAFTYDNNNPSARSYINTDGTIDDISAVGTFSFNHIIEKIADARAENGAEQQRIQQSYEFHQTNLVNIEAAHGRIMDADVALESTRFAKNNVLVQASASMTAQANQLTQVALTLLQ